MRVRLLWVVTAAVVVLPASACAKDFVFAAYNLESFFATDRPEESASPPRKSAASINALVEILYGLRADVVGLSEMGSLKDLEYLRKRLAGRGREYPHFEFVPAAEGDRNLALLSRVPIVARQSATELTYEMSGARERVRRGFLDVTVEISRGVNVRLVGAHLKSRLTRNSPNEALARRNEAALLRRHVDQILATEPKALLLVWGDLNDVRNSPAVVEILGGKKTALFDLLPVDKLGDRWTWHDKTTDTYQRIDYLLANRALKKCRVQGRTQVDRSDNWRKASDHRAVLATFQF
ncbi:hypothetical protein AYO41_01880 [Verrucomicrobia bacterium SCGC AG-212-E04]|nr:hypothetical protein AYO41_01880 [Verrucomicrobia bacterium SCGC AG-212-E04]